jgi:hypothetical protein
MPRGFADPPLRVRNATTEDEILQAYRSVWNQICQFVETLPDALD